MKGLLLALLLHGGADAGVELERCENGLCICTLVYGPNTCTCTYSMVPRGTCWWRIQSATRYEWVEVPAPLVFADVIDAGQPDAAGIEIPTTCATSLCGDPFYGEFGCSCWGLPRRCWDREVDCQADARCVTADPVHGEQRCAAKVKAARDGGRPWR